ncbi:MAG: DUF5686 family protein, partial [Bacteroidota bacterium]
KYGTLTTQDGGYRLKLPAGEHTVFFSYLGFRKEIRTVNLIKNQTLSIALVEEQVETEEVLITDDGRDPAYALIKLAIKNKKKNSRPFPEYQYQAYSKMRLGFPENYNQDSLRALFDSFGSEDDEEESESKKKKKPKKEPESEQDEAKEEEDKEVPLMLQSGILYLSETVSEVFVKEPNQAHERILSSRVSGRSKQFSFLGSLSNRFDVYKNRMVMEGVSDRGVVSPIAGDALFFYDYKLLGTVKEGGFQTYKIQVIPKREIDPVFRGIIYLADSTYAVSATDLVVTRKQSISLLDTLAIRQDYLPVEGAWLPFKTRKRFAFNFSFFVIQLPFSGTTTTLLSGYEVNKGLEKKIFRQGLIAIDDSALTYDDAYWKQVRPVPLTVAERKDYTVRDSLEAVYTSPAYLDSLTRATRRVNVNGLLFFGQTFRNFRKKTSLKIDPLLEQIGFNPMEGWFAGAKVTKTWEREKQGSFSISPAIRYGFSNEQFGYQLTGQMTGKNGFRLTVSGGDYISEFSRFSQIPFYNNTYNALADKQSFMRLYRKRFGEAEMEAEPLNGLSFVVNARYEDRSEMENTSDFTFSNNDEPYEPNFTLPAHEALIGEVTVRYRPFNKYIQTPNGRISLGSRWPQLEATYTKGFPELGGDAADFQKLTVGIRKTSRLGIFGKSSWRVTAGRFLSQDQVYFPDVFHFKGNQIFIRFQAFDEFFLLPYYERSSTRDFVEGHWEHAFEGFLLNKVPGVRKLKLKEYAGLHYLIQENGNPYLELNVGLEARIFRVLPLRFDLNFLLIGNGSRARDFGWKFQMLENNVVLGG